MASPHLRNAHERLQEVLRTADTPSLPGASLSNSPQTQLPMTPATVALEPQRRPTMDPFSEMRAGAWRLQQIAYQMYMIRASYPLSDNPHAQYSAAWVGARVHHKRLLDELEQGLANYQAHGLCQVQYLEIETAYWVNDEHEIRVAEGVKPYCGYALLHYRKVLQFQFVDALKLGPENHNLYLDPQFHPMGTPSNPWQRDGDVQPDVRSFQPPTPKLHPQVMIVGGRSLIASPVQLPRPAVPLRSPFCPTQKSDDEDDWDEYWESGSEAEDEGDGTIDSDAQGENGNIEYYGEYLESETSEDESESDEEPFHGFSPIHMSTIGIGYLYRTSPEGTLQRTSGVNAAANSYDRTLHSHLQPLCDVYAGSGSSCGGFRRESEGGCPLNWEDEHNHENPRETSTTSNENPDTPSYTEGVTTSGGVALSDADLSEGESGGGVPLYDFETVGFDRTLPEDGNKTIRDSLEQMRIGQPKSERSQDEDLSEVDIAQAEQVSQDGAWNHSSRINHGTPALPALPPNPVDDPKLAVPREARAIIVNDGLPTMYPVTCTPQAWNTQPAESSTSQPQTTAPPNWGMDRSQCWFPPQSEPTVAPTAQLLVHADATGEPGRSVPQESMEERVRAMLIRHMQGNMEERVHAMLTRQSSRTIGPPPGPCIMPTRMDTPGSGHEFTPPSAYSPSSPPASFNRARVAVAVPPQLEPSLRRPAPPADLLGNFSETALYIASISIVGRPGPTWCYQVGEDLLMLHDDARGNMEPEWRHGIYANRSPGAKLQ
ncbi:hypothetical protein L211DRAFT_62576 [Terfezia boudieri ATCC MYA-4762]|uniref:Uncharacterized protein n=1 Tax=Terfezia boudieri ATCC MYA-4762 TaxID=1051890 RepID=A0A3N4LYX8_9PEZI|nr:hypothetical protein L211DRAFT_62576 [Terfezia boudieri ATCC MYA-4762]